MADQQIIQFNIAAVVVMLVSLASYLIRPRAKTPANRVYLSVLVLVLATAAVDLTGNLYDLFLAPSIDAQAAGTSSLFIRDALQLLYYLLRSLTAPAYLVLIATVSATSHKLNQGLVTRILLWAPMLFTFAVVLTNPLHHLVYSYQGGVVVRGVGALVIYTEAIYYSLIGMAWLIRWKATLSADEFTSLMMQYPLMLIAVYTQYYFPRVHVEMFATAVSIMLVSTFVLRPENQMDSLVSAASLQAYRDMCKRAFLTQKPLCLIYLELIHMDRLRELAGKDQVQDIVRAVSDMLGTTLEQGDVLYYLRNGLFCISSVNLDATHAIAVAESSHQRGRANAPQRSSLAEALEMRTCVVCAPEDVSDFATLTTFVSRFADLVPDSRVTSFKELSKRNDFKLNMELNSCLARAIDDRSFEVHFQPIYSLVDERFVSAEALVRLNDPEFGFIPPSLFIPEAEKNGLIVEIGTILFEKICAFLAQVDYERTGLSYVEVNLSTEQCVRPNLPQSILGTMQEHGVDPARINLEITESSSAFSQSIVEANVRLLAGTGITFSLDDYGTGYSNLCRALSLPFTIVKLDKSFVDGMADENIHAALEKTISLMRETGKKILVEGVESEEQAEELRRLGADYIQGYLYAKPLAQDDFVAFLEEKNAR